MEGTVEAATAEGRRAAAVTADLGRASLRANRAPARALLAALVFCAGLQTTSFADDGKEERQETAGPRWAIAIWGLSYHTDKRIDYDEINWGLGLRRYARPRWRWLGKSLDNRLFLEGDAIRNSNGGLAVPLSAGAEYRIGSASEGCKFFVVGTGTLAYYQNPEKDRTELKFGPVPGFAIGCGPIKFNVAAVLRPSRRPLAAVVGSMTIPF